MTKFGRALCLMGASLGVIALIGWLTGVEALYSAIPGGPPMMPDTAISTLLLGIAGALRHPGTPGPMWRFLCASAAIAVLMLNLGTLAEYALDLNLGLDQLFLPVHAGPYSAHLYPGRTSFPSATGLALLATALLVFDARLAKPLRLTEWFVLTAAVLGFTALLGQLFGAGPHYHLTAEPAVGSSIPTALSFLMISFGLLLERPDAGVMRALTAPTPGGVLLRRLALAAILTPVASGLIAAKLLQFTRAENVDIVDFLFAAVTVVSAVASLFLLAITAVRLDRTHDALEKARVQTRDLIEQASDGIFVADLDGRYVDVNNVGCRMLGYSREEILSKTVMDLIRPEDLLRLDDLKSKLLRGAVKINDWNLVCKDGSLLPTEVSTKILPDGRWQAFVRDISDRKRAEEALRLSEATARQATMARDEVLSIVAHDLRNPLQIVTINADYLRRSGPEPASEMAAEIGDAANRMNRLIQDLVEVTSIELGHLSLRPERLYAAEIVSELLEMQTPLTKSASLELRVTIAPDLPDIWADHDRMLQVFENLIGNAIKFTKPGGYITLAAEASTGEVVFSVADTGSGIAESDLPHVFDRFWQASRGAHRGAGLGLAIVKGIVEAHGGRIWVRSTSGQGTTFFFTIPTVPQSRHGPKARSPRANALPATTNLRKLLSPFSNLRAVTSKLCTCSMPTAIENHFALKLRAALKSP